MVELNFPSSCSELSERYNEATITWPYYDFATHLTTDVIAKFPRRTEAKKVCKNPTFFGEAVPDSYKYSCRYKDIYIF